MAFKHFIRKEREVYLGSWLFGGPYTVSPMSVIRWFQLAEAYVEFDLIRLVRSRKALRATASLMVDEPVRPSHFKRITDAQLDALFSAFAEVNDLRYLAKQFRGDDEDGPGLGVPGVVDLLCKARPAYKHGEVMRMPVVTLFAILEAVSSNERRPDDEDEEELTPRQLLELVERREKGGADA
jgi:hypothetical protein